MNNDTIISALQKEMDKSGFISKESVKKISERIGKPESEIFGVVTFYSQFSLTPKAKFNIDVCLGTACFVLGGETVLDILTQKIGIKEGEISKDGLFKINKVRCLGLCSMAPAISVNGEVHGNMTKDKIFALIESLEKGEKL